MTRPDQAPRKQRKEAKVPHDEMLTLDERGRSVPWAARTLHRLYNVAAQKILDEDNVSIAHWIYLRVLAERGAMSQADLSKRAGIASQTAVPALDSLEERGLVKRTRDPQDRRKYFVDLTDEGRALLNKLMPAVHRMLEAAQQGIKPDDLVVFWRVTDTLSGNLAKVLDDTAILD